MIGGKIYVVEGEYMVPIEETAASNSELCMEKFTNHTGFTKLKNGYSMAIYERTKYVAGFRAEKHKCYDCVYEMKCGICKACIEYDKFQKKEGGE